MAEQENDEQGSGFWHWTELSLEGAAHGMFVELPSNAASLIDWASYGVNRIPTLWGDEPMVEQPLTYAPDVRKWSQTIYDTVNEWTGYTSPVPETDGEKIVYGISEIGGQLLPGGLALKGTTGLMSGASNLSLSQIANPGFWGNTGKGALKFVWNNKLLTTAVATDAFAFDGAGMSLLADKVVKPAAAYALYDRKKDNWDVPTQYGHLQHARNAKGDQYQSVLDKVEDWTGWNIPDNWEEKLHQGLGWLGEGSGWSMLALGVATLFGANMVTNKLLGDNMTSSLVSIGLALAAAIYVPKLMQQFNVSANPIESPAMASRAVKPEAKPALNSFPEQGLPAPV